jgi:hypothetical protein
MNGWASDRLGELRAAWPAAAQGPAHDGEGQGMNG